jgi:hypothetical protein
LRHIARKIAKSAETRLTRSGAHFCQIPLAGVDDNRFLRSIIISEAQDLAVPQGDRKTHPRVEFVAGGVCKRFLFAGRRSKVQEVEQFDCCARPPFPQSSNRVFMFRKTPQDARVFRRKSCTGLSAFNRVFQCLEMRSMRSGVSMSLCSSVHSRLSRRDSHMLSMSIDSTILVGFFEDFNRRNKRKRPASSS